MSTVTIINLDKPIKMSDLKNGQKYAIENFEIYDTEHYAIAYDCVYEWYAGKWRVSKLSKKDFVELINDAIDDSELYDVVCFEQKTIDERIPKPTNKLNAHKTTPRKSTIEQLENSVRKMW